LNIEEGVVLEPNAAIGLIDTIQLYLNKEQLLAAKTTIFQNQKMYNRKLMFCREQNYID
jgi:HlyD family secretion protein